MICSSTRINDITQNGSYSNGHKFLSKIKLTQAEAVYDRLLATNLFLLVWVLYVMTIEWVANWPHVSRVVHNWDSLSQLCRGSQIALFVVFGALWLWKWLLHWLKRRDADQKLMWKILNQDRFDN